MKMKMEDGYIYIIEADATQSEILKSWKYMVKWDKRKKWWKGAASLEFLDRLSGFVPLPETIKAEYQRMAAVQKAVDAERVKAAEKVKPLANYPVKKKLYTHQCRAANMCLLTFGLVKPNESLERRA